MGTSFGRAGPKWVPLERPRPRPALRPRCGRELWRGEAGPRRGDRAGVAETAGAGAPLPLRIGGGAGRETVGSCESVMVIKLFRIGIL